MFLCQISEKKWSFRHKDLDLEWHQMYDPNQKDSIMRKEVISLTLNQHYFYDF